MPHSWKRTAFMTSLVFPNPVMPRFRSTFETGALQFRSTAISGVTAVSARLTAGRRNSFLVLSGGQSTGASRGMAEPGTAMKNQQRLALRRIDQQVAVQCQPAYHEMQIASRRSAQAGTPPRRGSVHAPTDRSSSDRPENRTIRWSGRIVEQGDRGTGLQQHLAEPGEHRRGVFRQVLDDELQDRAELGDRAGRAPASPRRSWRKVRQYSRSTLFTAFPVRPLKRGAERGAR